MKWQFQHPSMQPHLQTWFKSGMRKYKITGDLQCL